MNTLGHIDSTVIYPTSVFNNSCRDGKCPKIQNWVKDFSPLNHSEGQRIFKVARENGTCVDLKDDAGLDTCHKGCKSASYHIGGKKYVREMYSKNLNMLAVGSEEYQRTSMMSKLNLPTPACKKPYPMVLNHNGNCQINFMTSDDAIKGGMLPRDWMNCAKCLNPGMSYITHLDSQNIRTQSSRRDYTESQIERLDGQVQFSKTNLPAVSNPNPNLGLDPSPGPDPDTSPDDNNLRTIHDILSSMPLVHGTNPITENFITIFNMTKSFSVSNNLFIPHDTQTMNDIQIGIYATYNNELYEAALSDDDFVQLHSPNDLSSWRAAYVDGSEYSVVLDLRSSSMSWSLIYTPLNHSVASGTLHSNYTQLLPLSIYSAHPILWTPISQATGDTRFHLVDENANDITSFNVTIDLSSIPETVTKFAPGFHILSAPDYTQTDLKDEFEIEVFNNGETALFTVRGEEITVQYDTVNKLYTDGVHTLRVTDYNEDTDTSTGIIDTLLQQNLLTSTHSSLKLPSPHTEFGQNVQLSVSADHSDIQADELSQDWIVWGGNTTGAGDDAVLEVDFQDNKTFTFNNVQYNKVYIASNFNINFNGPWI